LPKKLKKSQKKLIPPPSWISSKYPKIYLVKMSLSPIVLGCFEKKLSKQWRESEYEEQHHNAIQANHWIFHHQSFGMWIKLFPSSKDHNGKVDYYIGGFVRTLSIEDIEEVR